MPILDGHKASVQIREAGIRVPIVAMTAYALKGDKERCLEHGMDDYVPKPVQKQFLIKVLCRWLLTEKDYRVATTEDFARASLLELKKIQQQPPSFKKMPKALMQLPPIQVEVLPPKPPFEVPSPKPQPLVEVSRPNGIPEAPGLGAEDCAQSQLPEASPPEAGLPEASLSEASHAGEPVQELPQEAAPRPPIIELPADVPAEEGSQQVLPELGSELQLEAQPQEPKVEKNHTPELLAEAHQQQPPSPQSNGATRESEQEARAELDFATQQEPAQGIQHQI